MLHRISRAFTLFEFIVVVAITGIVVIVMVWNSQYFLTQVKVMKVKEEHALLRRALEKYRVDYAAFPNDQQNLAALDRPSAYVGTLPEDPFQPDQSSRSYRYYYQPGGGVEWALISPGPDGVIDFEPQRFGGTMASSVIDPRRGLLAFAGPAAPAPPRSLANLDAFAQSSSIVEPIEPSVNSVDGAREAFRQYLIEVRYDPTNGVTSAGDIITLSD